MAWFSGVFLVDACRGRGNNKDFNFALYTSNEITGTDLVAEACISKSIPSRSPRDEIDKHATVFYELKLGHLSCFPTDIIFEILSRLPVKDLMKFRTVCKSWNKLIKNPQFVDLQVSRAKCQPPGFLFQQSTLDSGRNLFLMEITDSGWRCKELEYKSFHGRSHVHLSNSCNGMICISRLDGDDPFIYNPITTDHIALPKSDFNARKLFSCAAFGFAFGFNSVEKKYKVVRASNIYHDIEGRKFHTTGEIITLGESSWRKLEFPHKLQDDGTLSCVFLNGAFHWMIHREKECSSLDLVLVLDIRTEKFQTITFPPIPLPKGLDLCCLGESLALIKHSGFNSEMPQVWQILGSGVYVFRVDTSFLDARFSRGLTILGMLNNGDILCKALQTNDVDDSFIAFRNHLVCYSPEKEEGYIYEPLGLPRLFSSIHFVPTLAAPSHFSRSHMLG